LGGVPKRGGTSGRHLNFAVNGARRKDWHSVKGVAKRRRECAKKNKRKGDAIGTQTNWSGTKKKEKNKEASVMISGKGKKCRHKFSHTNGQKKRKAIRGYVLAGGRRTGHFEGLRIGGGERGGKRHSQITKHETKKGI